MTEALFWILFCAVAIGATGYSIGVAVFLYRCNKDFDEHGRRKKK